jgi:hypothetical protein
MIRVLSGSVIPVLGLGAAIMLLGPGQLIGPRGEPLVVDAPAASAIHQASFEGQPCATPLLFSEEDQLAGAEGAGVKALTITFGFGADGTAVAVEEGVTEPDADAAVVALFDADGRLVAIMPSRIDAAAATRADCPAADTPLPAGI